MWRPATRSWNSNRRRPSNRLVCPVAGTVRYVNREASDDPGIITNDPYGEGWILKIELDDDEPALLTAEEYAKLVK